MSPTNWERIVGALMRGDKPACRRTRVRGPSLAGLELDALALASRNGTNSPRVCQSPPRSSAVNRYNASSACRGAVGIR